MNRTITDKLKAYETLRIPLLGGYWYRFLSRAEQKSLEKETIPYPALNQTPRQEKIICSMTSFPARISYVHLAIKSLLLQSCKPDRILLWLAQEQFPDKILPDELTALQQYGLEILWCHDLYGHKKYLYPVQQQQPDEVVITFDDDILYPVRCVERLMKKHREFPHCLVCERAQAMDPSPDRLDNPGRWRTISDVGIKTPSYSLNPSPGGGCLIPWHAFTPDAVDVEKIRKYAYKNDDLWYMFMCAENGTRIIKTRKYHKLFTLIEGSQAVQMATENVVGNRNTEIMQGLKNAYPQAYQRIITDQD